MSLQLHSVPALPTGSRKCIPLRILVVDPDPDSRAIYRAALQHHGHYVLVAENGREALDRALWARPHAVVTSVHHPGLSGVQLIRALKRDLRTEDVHVVAVTSDPRPETQTAVLHAGCNAYFLKPLSPRMLLQALTETGVEQALSGETEAEVACGSSLHKGPFIRSPNLQLHGWIHDVWFRCTGCKSDLSPETVRHSLVHGRGSYTGIPGYRP